MMTSKELCSEGEKLFSNINYNEQYSYERYVKHIAYCNECKSGLDINDEYVKLLEEFYPEILNENL